MGGAAAQALGVCGGCRGRVRASGDLRACARPQLVHVTVGGGLSLVRDRAKPCRLVAVPAHAPLSPAGRPALWVLFPETVQHRLGEHRPRMGNRGPSGARVLPGRGRG